MERIIVKRSKIGQGLFAARNIKKGEFITSFFGKKYHYNRRPYITSVHVRNHAIQIGYDTWIDSSKSTARLMNHSCNPNCGINGLRRLVAIRNIKKGDELTWDYATTENADWSWKCKCNTSSCRGTIGPWSLLPSTVKNRYKRMGIVSSWIIRRSV